MKQNLVILALALLAVSATQASDVKRFKQTNKAWQEECASCHIAYPPGLLSPASWQALMAGLSKHFGSDASLDAPRSKEITDFLVANASQRSSTAAAGEPLLRVSETAWFRRKHRDGHDGLSAAIWKSPAVKSAANCSACHTLADQGDYSDRNIQLPR
jgi:hypothetical protein